MIFYIYYLKINFFDIRNWGLGIGDWGLGVWAKTPNPKPQTPKPKTQIKFILIL